MTEEELARYFLSLDAPVATISPLEVDLGRVEVALAGEIPTGLAQVADLRVSLFRLSDSTDVPEVSKATQEVAQSTLHKLEALQVEKSGYRATFLSLDKEKNATLAENEQVAQRIQNIESTIASL